ncbi:MAG: hypothetical protein IPK11_12710 [Ignavibacteria bacterium]|nr:hypothetical protein [Ignavibacteria bacterium]
MNIKISDIDSHAMRVFIPTQQREKKDRHQNLPDSLLDQLREYYKQYKMKEYLFRGAVWRLSTVITSAQVFQGCFEEGKNP